MDYYSTNELYHYGVKGMKWGVRRYQNKDGSLTDKGRKKFYKDGRTELTKYGRKMQKMVRNTAEKNRSILNEYDEEYRKSQTITTNEHAKKLADNSDSKYNDYKKAEQKYLDSCSKKLKNEMEANRDALRAERSKPEIDSKKESRIFDEYISSMERWKSSGSKELKKKAELAYRDYEDARDMQNAAIRRENDRLYNKYLNKLSEKTLTDLGSENTERGRYFVRELIGNYYKHELD